MKKIHPAVCMDVDQNHSPILDFTDLYNPNPLDPNTDTLCSQNFSLQDLHFANELGTEEASEEPRNPGCSKSGSRMGVWSPFTIWF